MSNSFTVELVRQSARCRRAVVGALTSACVVLAALPAHASQIGDAVDALAPFEGQTITALTIGGQNHTKDYVIEREIHSAVGQPLDPELVREDMVRLENLSIFGSVDVAASEAAGGVALDFQFVELPTLLPYPAFSYTEANGFSVGVGLVSPNFTGRDITFATSVLFGGANSFNLSGSYPWITGNHVSMDARAWHKIRTDEILEYEETTDFAELTLGTYVGYHGRVSMRGLVLKLKSDKDNITLSPDNTDHAWGLGLTGEYDTRDSWRNPRRGLRSRGAVNYIGGDPDTWILDVDLRFYFPAGEKNAIATGPLLTLQSGDVGVEVPSYMQFFLGGANSIRGYTLKELGKELYGKNQLLYTLEYRYLLRGIEPLQIFKWAIGVGVELAAFGDVGTAWSRPEDLSLDRTRAGIGAGVRLLLPAVERIRFDVAWGDRGDFVFNFGVESNFEARTKRIR